MAIVLYDLVGADRYFSPFCWRIRWALAHKGLDVEIRPTRFTEIKEICGGGHKLVPVIDDGGKIVANSIDIALYLDETYPDAPTLLPGPLAQTKFIENWSQAVVHPGLVRMVVNDIHDHLTPEDQPFFRETREKRFGMPLDQVQADRDERIDAFRASLAPLRVTLEENDFLGGDTPVFADYIVAGAFQWARVISPFKLLAADDPVHAWFARCLDLYDEMGGRMAGYPI